MEDRMQLFEDQEIRTAWDAENEIWYFSVVDVVKVLTNQPDTRRAAKYWSVMKTRLKKESGELTTKCSQLKLRSADGKRYATDVADTRQLLRIIQSIPSPKAEPFKLWLAQVGTERIDEAIDPELVISRCMAADESVSVNTFKKVETIRLRAGCEITGVETGKVLPENGYAWF